MLYVSTRNKTDSFTAHRTLCADRTPDGGLFVPHKIPKFCPEGSFGKIVADVLNLFFSSSLMPRDVELCVGRQPIRLKEMSYRLLIAEYFHNPDGKYSYVENNLYKKLAGSDAQAKPTFWARVAIRIALLFAVHATIDSDVVDSYDVAVTVGDFTTPMAVWYARSMGLPVETIICSCNDNSVAWDLIQRGEMNTATEAVNTEAPDLDSSFPALVECLIYQTLGLEETVRFAKVCGHRGCYRVDKEQLVILNAGLTASVVSCDRIKGLINNVRATCDYALTDQAAISYGGVQDYRARSGESRSTMLFVDSDPINI